MTRIPKEFEDYLKAGHLSEGFLEIEPGYFQLWPFDEIEQYNKDYDVAENAPGYMGFGSSGGGEMLAFNDAGSIVMIPFVGMSSDDAIVVAQSWAEFTNAIER